MDPLSLTASVAGLLSLTINVTDILSKYIRSVKKAEQESLELKQELCSLCEVLKQLDQFLDGEKGLPPRFKDTSALFTSIQTCHATLNSLSTIVQKLPKERLEKKWYRKLIWSLQRDGKMDTIATIRRCIQIFQFSLTIEGCDVLSKTLDEVLVSRETQLNTSKNVTEIVELVKKIQIDLDRKRGLHDSQMSELHQRQMADERQKLLEWIGGSTNPSSNHNRAMAQREPKTGLWFLESDDFSGWIKSPRLLWLHGIRKHLAQYPPSLTGLQRLFWGHLAGCGKTVLCSTIIEAVKELCSEGTAGKLGYFYFNFQDFQNDSHKEDLFMSALPRSLLRQLCANEPTLPDPVQAIYTRHHGTGSNPTHEELTSALDAVIDQLAKDVYIILDALDEFPENTNNAQRKKLLKWITLMVDGRFQNLHILTTSRKEWDIDAALGNLANGGLPIQGPAVDSDIQRYIRSSLEEGPLSRWRDKIKIRASIETRLTEGAKGMFRWVVCQLDMLGECTTVKSVGKALAELLVTLDDTYERILNAIPRRNKDDARPILQWLAYSKRPLTLDEVAEAAVLRPGDGPIDADELCDLSEVLRICRSLVTLATEVVCICANDSEIEVVKFAHFSVLEYLTSRRSDYFSVSAMEATATSDADEDIPTGIEDYSDGGQGEDADSRPVANYAAEYWYEHVCEVEKVNDRLSKFSDSAYRFLGENSPRCFLKWLQMYNPQDQISGYLCRRYDQAAYFPLWYSSLLGIRHATRRLIESGADVNQQITGYGGALHTAAKRGHYEIAQILLESGADANRWNEDYGTPLECGVDELHLSICQLLIDHGADVNAATRHENGSVLLVALDLLDPSTLHGVNIVQLLLTHGANVNARMARGWAREYTALHVASAKGFLGIVQSLLDKGADINAPGGDEVGTALQEASRHDQVETVQLLLEHGADVNAPAGGKGTALQAACTRGFVQMVQLLLTHGADVNAWTDDLLPPNHYEREMPSTALQCALVDDRAYIVELLIECGADMNATNKNGRTALDLAKKWGKEESIRVLVEHGATETDAVADSESDSGLASRF
ncbi:Serine/threonine-protein kinase GCN2 [Fonsecaea nubica]|uniref:Serine/threonine-protein kinase GCN2 n=1 Tax=Fonsecaea nubica TaxID=856822 RepID=A0A178CT82_9EURO|nr:Serine/threonine-protein kinase GCN2 [Fonsecaea nubica]OAL32656.1 Serine/threonine-protein kinase GCN2 [Fonsecaea nubica]